MEEYNLYQKLINNAKSDYYPYHMPGHKRQLMTETLKRVGDLDITEIDGFDNLHYSKEILKDIQKHAAKVYGAEETFYLINGSTAGILSAISTAIPKGGKILMSRHCHRAAYHGIYLRELQASYLWAEIDEENDIHMGISPKQVEDALKREPDISALLIVSPTYEGITSDIEKISEIAHKHDVVVIVDEAHGAHFGFHPAWPRSSCIQGADIVIQSLHKTLPSMTQTALLHVNGKRVDREQLRRFLTIYQSSSPSYVMMAGMEEAVSLVEQKGSRLFEQFLLYWNQMLSKLSYCKNIRVFPSQEERENKKMDIGKLIISVKNTEMTGQQLYNTLLEKYHLQMEMAAGTYVLAMFSLADTKEGYDRLTSALLEIDKSIEKVKTKVPQNICWTIPEKVMEIWEAWDRKKEKVLLEESIGCIAGEYINLYPPGAPIIVPGEKISCEIVERITKYIHQDLMVHGVNRENEKVYATILKC